jgi:hypothetical protein
MSWTGNVNNLHRCIKSALNNLVTRGIADNPVVLEDIQSDLEGALKAVKELIAITLKEREV